MTFITPGLTQHAQDASAVLIAYGLTAPSLLGALFIVWACFKTGSSRLMRARLWRWMSPGHEHSSSRIKQFIQEADDLAHLHVVHGIKLRTIAAYDCLIAWIRTHGESLSDVSACGPFFDTQGLGPSDKAPGRKTTAAIGLGFVLACWASLAAMTLGIVAGGIITIKDSGNSFMMSETGMKPLNWFEGKKPLIHLSECLGPSKALLPFKLSDRETLCELVTSPQYGAWLDEVMLGQRMLLAVLSGGLLWLTLTLLKLLRNAVATWEMKKRLSARIMVAAHEQLLLWPHPSQNERA